MKILLIIEPILFLFGVTTPSEKLEVSGSIKFDNSLLSKLDIFCQLLNDNLSAANLLNVCLIESA